MAALWRPRLSPPDGFAGLETGDQSFRQAAFGAGIAFEHRVDDGRAGQHVAGGGDFGAADMAGPADAVGAGVLGGAAVGVDDVELALVLAWVGVGQGGNNRVGRFAGAEPGHAVHGVHRVD